jgi:uncharacterized membrane protein YdjX (TVP38/TMEM64 family)
MQSLMSPSEPPSEPPSGAAPALAAGERSSTVRARRIAFVLGVLALLIVLARQAGHYLPAVAQWVEELGVWGPLVFIVAYAAAVVAFVPGALLTLAGGAIFDLGWGTLYVFTAAVLGSSAAFLISRYLARGLVERRFSENPRFTALDRAIGDQGLKIMFLLRLSPAFPFSFMNYAVGLTGIRFRDYLLASVGMLPGTVLYVYYGKLVGDVAALASGVAPEHDAGYYAWLALGLAATVAVTALVARTASRALREANAGE